MIVQVSDEAKVKYTEKKRSVVDYQINVLVFDLLEADTSHVDSSREGKRGADKRSKREKTRESYSQLRRTIKWREMKKLKSN